MCANKSLAFFLSYISVSYLNLDTSNHLNFAYLDPKESNCSNSFSLLVSFIVLEKLKKIKVANALSASNQVNKRLMMS